VTAARGNNVIAHISGYKQMRRRLRVQDDVDVDKLASPAGYAFFDQMVTMATTR
jgi:hypothetical protein